MNKKFEGKTLKIIEMSLFEAFSTSFAIEIISIF